jgi:hypothetical protein
MKNLMIMTMQERKKKQKKKKRKEEEEGKGGKRSHENLWLIGSFRRTINVSTTNRNALNFRPRRGPLYPRHRPSGTYLIDSWVGYRACLEAGKQITSLCPCRFHSPSEVLLSTVLRRITTFRSTTDRIYDGGVLRL